MNGRAGVSRVLAYKHVPREGMGAHRSRARELARWGEMKFLGEIHEKGERVKMVSANKPAMLGIVIGLNLDGRTPESEELVETLKENDHVRWKIPPGHVPKSLTDSELKIVRDKVKQSLEKAREELVDHTE